MGNTSFILQVLRLSGITAVYWLMALAPPIEAHITCISKRRARGITPQISFLQEVVYLTCAVSHHLPILTLEHHVQTTFFERFITNYDTYDMCVKYLGYLHAQAAFNSLSDC